MLWEQILKLLSLQWFILTLVPYALETYNQKKQQFSFTVICDHL